MNKIALIVEDYLLNNKIFGYELDIDNYLDCFRALKNELLNYGYDLSTYDINTLSDSQYRFYFSLHDKNLLPETTIDIQRSYLFLFESEMITPELYNKEIHNHFNKVFTFNDKLVDNIKYFKMNYSFTLPILNFKTLTQVRNKLCVLVSRNKANNYKLELYSKRVEAIRWFEENHPNDFDLYGIGWDKYVSNYSIIRKLCRRIKLFNLIMSKLYFKVYPSYKHDKLVYCVAGSVLDIE